jgi:hypothetical protein
MRVNLYSSIKRNIFFSFTKKKKWSVVMFVYKFFLHVEGKWAEIHKSWLPLQGDKKKINFTAKIIILT